MASIADMFRRLFNLRRPKPETNVEQRVSWLLQPYAGTAQDILLWRNKFLSAVCLTVINLILLLLRRWDVRPVGLIAGVMLLVVILDGMATALGAGRRPYRERNSDRNGGEQLTRAIAGAQQWLHGVHARWMNLRQENPSKFCFVTCSLLGALWLAARIGGALLVHFVVNLAFVSPLWPDIQKTISSIQSQGDSDGEVEEFLPEMSKHVMEELHRAGEYHDARELPSLPSIDLSLPPDASILYAAAEGESSDDDDNFIEPQKGYSSTPSPLTDSSDSDSDFIPKEKRKVSSASGSTSETASLLSDVPAKNPVQSSDVTDGGTGWIPYILGAAGSYLGSPPKKSAKPDSESDLDDFEVVEASEL